MEIDKAEMIKIIEWAISFARVKDLLYGDEEARQNEEKWNKYLETISRKQISGE